MRKIRLTSAEPPIMPVSFPIKYDVWNDFQRAHATIYSMIRHIADVAEVYD